MAIRSRYLEAPRRLRAFVRAHETSLAVLAALIGTIGGLVVAAMSAAVEGLHVLLLTLKWANAFPASSPSTRCVLCWFRASAG
jgi:CIC family chloride channel protein